MGRAFSRQRKSCLIFTILIVITICLFFQSHIPIQYSENWQYVIINGLDDNSSEIMSPKKWMELKKDEKNLSKLGRILYLNEDEPEVPTSTKRYRILVWKYGATIESRHLKNFSHKKVDPFLHCSVKNCDITYKDSSIKTADIVIFHLHRMKNLTDLPSGKRNPNQIWAFLTDESPQHTFLVSKLKMKDFNGVFNWSMTYRINSDIPVPYGRTVVRKNPKLTELVLNKRRDVLIAILGSNCGGKNNRWAYVKELQKYIKVDVYGGCGTLKTCPGHFRLDCPDIDRYLFYLSFENSNCDDYITEKLWWNAYKKNSIPIVMGAEPSNYKKLLPPGSYINVEEFASPAVLAQFIRHLNDTDDFKHYYRWKMDYEVLNEHGYFKTESFHYCRICQALNYNDKSPKVYDKLDEYWSAKRDCHPAWNNND